MCRARAAFISTKSRWIEATIQRIKLRDSIVTYITDTMHAMFSIVAISFDEFKIHFTSVEDTASVLVWVDAQLQQLFNVFAKTVLPSGNLQLIGRCCSEALKYAKAPLLHCSFVTFGEVLRAAGGQGHQVRALIHVAAAAVPAEGAAGGNKAMAKTVLFWF